MGGGVGGASEGDVLPACKCGFAQGLLCRDRMARQGWSTLRPREAELLGGQRGCHHTGPNLRTTFREGRHAQGPPTPASRPAWTLRSPTSREFAQPLDTPSPGLDPSPLLSPNVHPAPQHPTEDSTRAKIPRVSLTSLRASVTARPGAEGGRKQSRCGQCSASGGENNRDGGRGHRDGVRGHRDRLGQGHRDGGQDHRNRLGQGHGDGGQGHGDGGQDHADRLGQGHGDRGWGHADRLGQGHGDGGQGHADRLGQGYGDGAQRECRQHTEGPLQGGKATDSMGCWSPSLGNTSHLMVGRMGSSRGPGL